MCLLQEIKREFLLDFKKRARKLGCFSGIICTVLLTLSACYYAGINSRKWFIIFSTCLAVGFTLSFLIYLITPCSRKWCRRIGRKRLAREEMEQIKREILRSNPNETRFLRSLLNIHSEQEGSLSYKQLTSHGPIKHFEYQPQRTWISEPSIFNAKSHVVEIGLNRAEPQEFPQDLTRNEWRTSYQPTQQTMTIGNASRQLEHVGLQMNKARLFQVTGIPDNARAIQKVPNIPPKKSTLSSFV